MLVELVSLVLILFNSELAQEKLSEEGEDLTKVMKLAIHNLQSRRIRALDTHLLRGAQVRLLVHPVAAVASSQTHTPGVKGTSLWIWHRAVGSVI
eukprot:8798041-Prorocentrum_lima.AAC.1